MAVVAMEKVQILGIKQHLKSVLDLLQKQSVMQVEEIGGDKESTSLLQALQKEEHDIDYVIANTEFAIKLLEPYAKKRPIWAGKPVLSTESALGTVQSFDYRAVVTQCQELEEKNVAARHRLHGLKAEEDLLTPWKRLSFKLDTPRETKHVDIQMGTVPPAEIDSLTESLKKVSPLLSLEKVHEDPATVYLVLAVGKKHRDEIRPLLGQHKFQETELPTPAMTVAERLNEIAEEKARIQADLTIYENDFKELARHHENLQIVHDVFLWQMEEQRTREKLKGTHYSFMITGWVPKNEMKVLQGDLEEIAPSNTLHKIKPKEDEAPPILLKNNKMALPFESVTKLYGFPLPNEVDPTPFLATFFIVFFALCLTDAGYGLLLFVIMFLMLRFVQLPTESRKLIKLLMWGGLITMVSGYFFGGYFGLTPEQAPSFLVRDDGASFKGQLINATSGQGPLTFLILALVLGIIQVLVGKLLDGFWKIRQGQYLDALLDSFLWVYFLLVIMGFGLASTGMILSTESAELFKWLVLGGVAAMILTQGRKQKSFIGKLGLGILSLYGLVGYLGDILSYSRIMALGLGTGIIAFAMNTIAGLAYELIPYVGIVFAIIVLILGHTMNLVLSALGAFIHSARLQFVEFFSKFMEGGGTSFKPFQRTCKYIIIT